VNVKQAKQSAKAWVDANLDQWPGLRAAHLVGGVTTMDDDASFPTYKDVDVHLIFADGSPALAGDGWWSRILEAPFGGVAIEAGVKSVAEYRSAEAVLANPEIAHHLTVDSVLYDPEGMLRDLQGPVRVEYPRRRWVRARLDHERRALTGALDLLRKTRDSPWGASGEVNILGYSTTFAIAALSVATLNPPRLGGQLFVRLREVLAPYGRLDLQRELLANLGLANICPEQVERFLAEAIEGFDLAVELRRTASPFQHKLQRHLRPYFVESCRSMLAAGYHHEAMGWVLPYYLGTTDVILADGPEADKPFFAARLADLLQALGLDTTEARAAATVRAVALYDRMLDLAEAIVASHPGIVD
jgi:hypothetical protein